MMNEDQIKTKAQMRDPIERQAAIDLVKDVCDTIMDECDSHYDHEIGDEVYNDILEVDAILKCNKEIRIALASLPSAQPERKTGKWIPFEYGDDTWHKCTACGVADNYISIVQRPNGKTGRLESVRNYCPNCGAKMEEEGCTI